MRHLLPILAGLLPLAGHAQPAPAWTGATALPTPVATEAPTLVADAAGNTYVAGSFAPSITLAAGTSLTSQGGQDGYVAKYGPTGALLWYRQLAGPGTDYFQALVADASGSVALLAVAGNGARLGALTLTAGSTGTTLALARLDAQGQPQGLAEVASGPVLSPGGLARDPAGDLYISCTFALNAMVGSTALTTPSSTASGYAYDQVVAKVTATGAPQWVRQGGRLFQFPGSYPLFASSLAAGAGGLYLSWTGRGALGSFGSLALPGGSSATDYDALAVKFDLQGNPQWAKRFGTSNDERGFAGQLDASGRLVLPGLAGPPGFLATAGGNSNSVQTLGFVVVLEPAAGSVAWSGQLSATSAAAFRGVAADAAGNLYVAGSFGGAGSVAGTAGTSAALPGAGGLDAVVASFSPGGALRWVQQSGGTGSEVATAIGLDGLGYPHVAGSFSGEARFGGTGLTASVSGTVPTQGTPFVAQLGSVLTARAGVTAAPLACYPNPAASTNSLALPALPAGTQLTLTDATGRLVRRQPAAPTLPLTGLAPGLYQVQAQAPDGAQWQSRLLVE